jgi:hypothetical protein
MVSPEGSVFVVRMDDHSILSLDGQFWQESLKQWWSSISTKRTITSHFQRTEHEKTKTYDVRNPNPSLGQAHKCGRVKPVNETPIPPLDNWILYDIGKEGLHDSVIKWIFSYF